MPSEYETVITDQMEYGTVITTQGAAIIADCILNGTKLPIVEAGAGDGGGAPTVPVPSQTALVNERWRGEIVGKELSSTTPNMIDVKIVIGDDVGGFTIREMGLFSDTGVLIAVCNTPDTEKVPISGGVSGKLTMIMHIVVADASVLEFVINSSMDTINPEDLEKALRGHNTNPEAHPDLLARIRGMELALNGSETISGNGDPTAETKGVIGQHYINFMTGEEFVCTGVTEEGCIWEPLDAVKIAGQGPPLKAVTEEEYNALSEAEKAADVAYLVTDDVLAADDVQDSPELHCSNPNLLDNWYFADPVNQRGQAIYDEKGYAIDRWWLTSNNLRLTIEDGCIKIENKTDNPGWIVQRAEPALFKNLSGRTVTLSTIYKAEGEGFNVYCGYHLSEGSEFISKWGPDIVLDGTWRLAEFTYNDLDAVDVFDYQIIAYTVSQHSTLWLKAAKAELGPVQTLAHQDVDGNWVLNDPPPNKALELLKCQRYMVVLPNTESPYAYIGCGASNSTTQTSITIPVPTRMRALPTVTATGRWGLTGYGKTLLLPTSAVFRGNYYSATSVDVLVENVADLTAHQFYALQARSDETAQLILDANL